MADRCLVGPAPASCAGTRTRGGTSMTLIAGIFNRQGQPLSDSICRELARSVSRQAGDEVEVIRKPNAFFAKLDIGAFGSKGAIEGHDAVSLLTGEPLLERSSTDCGYVDRHTDLKLLHDDLAKGNSDRLRDANGAFSLVHYRPEISSLTLITDKCAIRPMYVWI